MAFEKTLESLENEYVQTLERGLIHRRKWVNEVFRQIRQLDDVSIIRSIVDAPDLGLSDAPSSGSDTALDEAAARQIIERVNEGLTELHQQA